MKDELHEASDYRCDMCDNLIVNDNVHGILELMDSRYRRLCFACSREVINFVDSKVPIDKRK